MFNKEYTQWKFSLIRNMFNSHSLQGFNTFEIRSIPNGHSVKAFKTLIGEYSNGHSLQQIKTYLRRNTLNVNSPSKTCLLICKSYLSMATPLKLSKHIQQVIHPLAAFLTLLKTYLIRNILNAHSPY